MVLELKGPQKQIQRAAAEFARGEFDRDEILELEKAGAFPARIFEAASELGFIGLHLDEAYGGGGMDLFDSLITAQALCRQDSACGMALTLAASGAELVQALGSPAQKAAVLEPVLAGKARCGPALLEPGMGDLSRECQTVARRRGDHWILMGEKTQVANGLARPGETCYFPLLCTTEEGPTLFLVDSTTPGIHLTPSPRKLGNNLCPTAEMVLAQAKVGEEQLLGRSGKAMAAVTTFMDQAKFLHGGMALGIAQGALDRALAYGKQREQFGRPILSFEALAHDVAEMALALKSAQSLVYDSVLVAGGKKKLPPGLGDLAMETACRAAESVSDAALQIHGGYGYMTEGEIEHFYRDAKYLKLYQSSPLSRLSAIAAAQVGTLSGPGKGKEGK